jgi:hypothetical protein
MTFRFAVDFNARLRKVKVSVLRLIGGSNRCPAEQADQLLNRCSVARAQHSMEKTTNSVFFFENI